MPIWRYRKEVIFIFYRIDTPLPPFLPLPRFLLHLPLSTSGKLLYTLLLNRTTLSQRNGWVSDAGFVYVIYTIGELAEDLGCSQRTVQNGLKELEQAGLLIRQRQGCNRANLLYLKFPSEEQKTVPPDRQISSPPDVQNLPLSNTYPSKKKKLNERVYDYENEEGECL